jgi:hypothetical protein
MYPILVCRGRTHTHTNEHSIYTLFRDKLSLPRELVFRPHNELVMSMPFEFIDGLKEKELTAIDKIWLRKLWKHLRHAQSTTIKQIRLIRHIGRDDFYKQSTEYKDDNDCYIYEIFQTNNTNSYVNLGQISGIIGEEEWLHGEVSCLCNIASSRIISLSCWAKKKESTNSPNSCLCVGDRVTVANHGNHWQQFAVTCSIDYSTKIAIVNWDVTWKKNPVDLGDCKKYDEMDVSQRKPTSTDFYFDMTDKKCKAN